MSPDIVGAEIALRAQTARIVEQIRRRNGGTLPPGFWERAEALAVNDPPRPAQEPPEPLSLCERVDAHPKMARLIAVVCGLLVVLPLVFV